MIFFSSIIIPFFLFVNTEKLNYSEKIPNSNFSIDMIHIPGGKFKMGNKNKNSDTEVSSFWISKYEITWEIYNLFMEHEENNKLEFVVGNEKIKVDGISKPTTPYTDMTFGMGYEGFPAINKSMLGFDLIISGIAFSKTSNPFTDFIIPKNNKTFFS